MRFASPWPSRPGRQAHKLHILVNPWTVNEENDLRECIRLVCDSIIANYPDRAARILWET